MKVILLENIASVGALGDVINVRPGYARNYLFPQGKAERASEDAVKRFESRRGDLQKRQQELESLRQEAYEALNGYLLQFTARASPDGNLYGSITPQMIAAALNAQQLTKTLTLKRGQIRLADGHIKSLGDHPASARLGAAAAAEFTVSVLAEAPSSSSHSDKTHDKSSAKAPAKDSE